MRCLNQFRESEKARHDEHVLKLAVCFEDEGGEFQIPACGHGGIGEFFSFTWNIDWGDGTHDHAVGISSSQGGDLSAGSLVHAYAAPGEYEIAVLPAEPVQKTVGDAPGWLQAFGYPEAWMFSVDDDNHFKEYVFPKGGDKLVCVDGVLDDYAINIELEGACAKMFSGCKNITMGPHFTFSSDKQRAGDFFCFRMFGKCDGDTFTMGDAFQLPENLREVGKAFCCKMFQFCSGKSFTMNDRFTIPQKIIDIGSGFCQEMFAEHGLGFTMGERFNLPQGITEVEHRFCAGMFSYCGGGGAQSDPVFAMNERFNLPPSISGYVGDDFCSGMFRSNSGNAFRMNERFNLPEGITRTGNAFCKEMFQGCSGNSFSMNDVFTMPAGLYEAGVECGMRMFSGCDGRSFALNFNFNLPHPFNAPAYLYFEMFGQCRLESLNWNVDDLVRSNPGLRIWSPTWYEWRRYERG